MNRLDHILLAKPDIVDGSIKKDIDKIQGKIEFRNLTFRYPSNENPDLKDINLSIKPGQIVAIVGKTGSGKTTLLNLLTRVYDPPEGCLYIDDYEIRDFPLVNLRKNIGFIPQDTFLFSDTIRNNIAFGVGEVDQDKIENAARMAEIHHSIIEFPKAYDTILGERGINLSGGQKQRISIARAILKAPSILIIDDALSAVDTVTEEAILNNMREIMINKTCLWVSHRISSIKNADYIIVLDEGAIVEEGTHDQLLVIGGIYADLFEKQQLEESLRLVE